MTKPYVSGQPKARRRNADVHHGLDVAPRVVDGITENAIHGHGRLAMILSTENLPGPPMASARDDTISMSTNS